MAISELSSRTVYRAGSSATATESRVRGTAPALLFSGSGSPTWNDGGAGGSFSPASGPSSTYTPLNKTQAVQIGATGNAPYSIQIYGTIPIHPQVGFEVEFDIETKVKYARDRTKYFREDGSVQVGWVLGWDDRDKTQKDELVDFWNAHRKITQFYMLDPESGFMNLVNFITSMKAKLAGQNRWALSAGVQGIYTNTAIGTTL